jgi:hypothetical protein
MDNYNYLETCDGAYNACHFLSIGNMPLDTAVEGYDPNIDEIIPFLRRFSDIRCMLDRGATLLITKPEQVRMVTPIYAHADLFHLWVKTTLKDEEQIEEYEFGDIVVFRRRDATRPYWGFLRQMITTRSIVLFWMEYVAKRQERRRIDLANDDIIENY